MSLLCSMHCPTPIRVQIDEFTAATRYVFATRSSVLVNHPASWRNVTSDSAFALADINPNIEIPILFFVVMPLTLTLSMQGPALPRWRRTSLPCVIAWQERPRGRAGISHPIGNPEASAASSATTDEY